MVRAIVICLALGACRHPAVTHAPVAAQCVPTRVGKVFVEGATAADVPQLAVLEGTLDNPARTERIAQVSVDVLRTRGFARAKVTVKRRSGCGVELIVAVDRGPRFRITDIAFPVPDDLPAPERLAAIEDALGTINTIGGAYVEDRLIRALDALRRRYHEAGWLEAEIDPPQPAFDEQRGAVTVTIPIRLGRRFKIGNVVARGGHRTTRAAVVEALGLRGGDWYDGAAVRAGIRRARREVDESIEMRLQVASERSAIDLEAVVGETR